MKRLPLLLIPILFCAMAYAERSTNPGINDHYEGARYEEWVDVFESSGREVYDKREAILETLNLRPGMAVADIGAGTGFFTLMFAKRVGPEGKVYAVDIAADFITNIELLATEAGHGNVIGVVNDGRAVGLAPNSVDLVFISATYHHFEYPRTTMAAVREALRPTGEVVVIDFRSGPGAGAWVNQHVRGGEAMAVREIEADGFELVGRYDFMQQYYFLRFRNNGEE